MHKEFRKHRGRAKCYSCCILILITLGLIIGISLALFASLEIYPQKHGKHQSNDNSILLDRLEKFHSEIKEIHYNSIPLDMHEKFPIKFYRTMLDELIKKPNRLLKSYHHHHKHFHKFFKNESMVYLLSVLKILLVIFWFLNGVFGYNASKYIRIRAARKFKIINTILLSQELIKFMLGTAFLLAYFIRTRYKHNHLMLRDDDIILAVIYFLFTIIYLIIWIHLLYIPINQHKTLLTLKKRRGIKKIKQLRKSTLNNPAQKIEPFNNNVIYQPNNTPQMYTFNPINQSQQPVTYSNQDIKNMSNQPHQITVPNRNNYEQINAKNNSMNNKTTYRKMPVNNNVSQQQAPYFNRNQQPIVGLRENDLFSTNTNKLRSINRNNSHMDNYPLTNNFGEQKNISNSFVQGSQVNVPEELECEEKIHHNRLPKFQRLNDFQETEEAKNGVLRTKLNNPFSTDIAMNRYNNYQPTPFMNNTNNLYPNFNDMQGRKF